MRLKSFVKHCALVACGILVTFAEVAQGQPGAVDSSFNSGDWLSQHPEWERITVEKIVRQRDGRSLVTYLGTRSSRRMLIRLHPDGRKDTGFAAPNGSSVESPVELQDGRILVRIGGKLQRLSEAGELDGAFSVTLNEFGSFVSDFVVQPDGKIIIAGMFQTVDGVERLGIARLLPSGRLDPSFKPDASRSYAHYDAKLALQPDGRVTTATSRVYTGSMEAEQSLVRFNHDGSLDASFSAKLRTTGSGGDVFVLACQPDGKLLVGGRFQKANGVERFSLARFHETGELDLEFNSGAGLRTLANNRLPTVRAITVLPDGKVAVGGDFDTANGQTHRALVRFLPDGSVDPGFVAAARTPGFGDDISSLLALPDGKLVIGGNFTAVENVTARSIAQLLGGDLPQPGSGQAVVTWPVLQVNEADGAAAISVRRIGGTSGTLTVAYETVDGTALAGEDYTNTPGNLVFADGETTKEITIPIVNDSIASASRQFEVRLTDPAQGTAVGTAAETIVSVQDDEQASIFQMSAASHSIPENAGTSGIRVRRMGSIAAGATVTFEVVNGTAVNTADFVLTAGELVFAEGELEKAIPVSVLQDGSLEGDEHFEVQLTGEPVGGSLGSLVSTTVSIVDSNDPGSLDDAFNAAITGEQRSVRCLLVQNDGKVIVGGYNLSAKSRSPLIRLNPDGSVDPTFRPSPQVPPVVTAITSQPDGKLVVAGSQTVTPHSSHFHTATVVRLHADGTLDSTFYAGEFSQDAIMSLAILPNGQIVVGCLYNEVWNLDTRPRLVRLESNGLRDSSFQPPNLGEIKHLVLLDDGSMVIGSQKLTKLTPAGILDPTFQRRAMDEVTALARDLEGRLLVSGIEAFAAGAINVVLSDGTVDQSFAAATDLDGLATAIAVLPDGRILAAGKFKTYAGASCGPVVRLLPNGMHDPTFSTFAGDSEGQLVAIGYSLEGDIYVGGNFSSIDGQSAPGIARLRGGSVEGNYFRFERGRFDVQEETVGKFQVRVLRLGAAEDMAKVEWTLDKGGSKAPADNYTRSGQLEFAPGVRVQSIELEVNDDDVFEADEYFALTLRDPTAGVVLAGPTAIRIGVKGSDSPHFGTIQFAAETHQVSETEGEAKVVVLRTGGSDGEVFATYTTIDQSAVGGWDFASVSGVLTFADGETSRTITIPLKRDLLAEPNKSFRVKLNKVADGATLGFSESTQVVITDSNEETLRVFRGSYHGSILTDGGATAAGRISMTLTANGAITGTVQLKDKRHSFRGRFNERGEFNIRIPGKPWPINIWLGIDLSGDSSTISGLLEQGGIVAQIGSDKAAFDSQKNPTFAAGAYTLLCKPVPDAPAAVPLGTGFAVVKVSRAGSMRWTGRLADGQPVSLNGTMNESGTCYVYLPLAKARGVLAGYLNFAQSERRDCSGEAQWIRNEKSSQPGSAFSVGLELTGSAFVPDKRTPLLPWNQGTLNLTGDDFPEQPPLAIQQSRPQRFVPVPSSLGLSLTVDPASGLLRGRFQHPTTKKNVSLSGAILTDEGIGAGYFLAPEPGGFEMNAAIVP